MKLPFLFVNMAMTADGKIATANRAISSFGSARDQENLHLVRARADAVMAGARTVDSNPVSMGPGARKYRELRQARGLAEYNLRVIVSGGGTIDPQAAIFKKRFSPILVLTTERIQQRQLRVLRGLADAVQICGERDIDFRLALGWLRQQWGVRRLLCEGGAELNGALFAAGLVDELNLTLCPFVFGGRSAPTIADGCLPRRLAEASRFKLKSFAQFGSELFLQYRRSDKAPSKNTILPPARNSEFITRNS